MKRLILLFSFCLNFICFGQDYTESKDLKLSEFNYEAYYKKAKQDGEYGFEKVFLIDKNGNKIEEFKIFPESFDSDEKVYESSEFKLKNVKKIIRLEIAHCPCYCETSKYYWLLTNENKWIKLPVIEEGIYEFNLKKLAYEFDSDSDTILLTEFQDEKIDENEIYNPKFRLKSKSVLKSYKWNGTELVEN